MKFIVALLCLVAVQSAPLPEANVAILPFGAFSAPWPIQDTPEVAAAKAEHFAVLNAARIRAGAAPLALFPFVHLPAHQAAFVEFPAAPIFTAHTLQAPAPAIKTVPAINAVPATSSSKTLAKSPLMKPLLRFVPDRKL